MSAHEHAPFLRLATAASGQYRSGGMTAWQFARGKLKGDPVYRAVWEGPWIQPGPVVDLGCGQGLMLALFIAARRDRALYPDLVSREACRLIGVETRARVAALASEALGPEVTILAKDVRHTPLPACRTVIFFDVLHMMSAADQDALLRAVLPSLQEDGVILIREADAASGWRYGMVRWANRIKAWVFGYSAAQFHFRTREGWRSWLEAHGLTVETRPMHAGTPFGNHLFIARRLSPRPAP